MVEVWLQPWARLLVVLHVVAAVVLVGAATHHGVVVVGYLRGVYRTRLARVYAATTAVAYAVTWGFGALAYPTFRYHVRGRYLDWHAPWASNLFDVKENFASLGLPAVVLVFALSRALDPKRDRAGAAAYAALVLGLGLLIWFDVIAGLVLTTVRSV